jgi:hypothetical protein
MSMIAEHMHMPTGAPKVVSGDKQNKRIAKRR